MTPVMGSRTPATIYRLRVDAQGRVVGAETVREAVLKAGKAAALQAYRDLPRDTPAEVANQCVSVAERRAAQEARASFALEEREWSPELAKGLRKIYDSRAHQDKAGMWTADKYVTGRRVQWKPFTINPVQHGVQPRATGKPSKELLGELKHLRQLAEDAYGQRAALARDLVAEIEHTIASWAEPTLIEEES